MNQRRRCQTFSIQLGVKFGTTVEAIHGDRHQRDRENALERFKGFFWSQNDQNLMLYNFGLQSVVQLRDPQLRDLVQKNEMGVCPLIFWRK